MTEVHVDDLLRVNIVLYLFLYHLMKQRGFTRAVGTYKIYHANLLIAEKLEKLGICGSVSGLEKLLLHASQVPPLVITGKNSDNITLRCYAHLSAQLLTLDVVFIIP